MSFELSVNQSESLTSAIRTEVEHLIDAGHLRIELCGHMICAPNVKGFTLDKRKYALRFEDETEDSVRIMIDRKDETQA